MAVEAKPSPGARERQLFLGALEQSDQAQRAAFLDAACGDDRALRRRLDDLLHEQEDVGTFLETPALAGARGTHGTELRATVIEAPGDRIGRYKLLQAIGEGGCGIVYMAEQETPVRRRVALKVIRLGMDTKSVIARFEAERQALAMMDHPNIAKVFDAGATETGRPYFVMELVRGIRITDYCDQNNLPTEDRLKLFTQACQAIQHAHQKGIIHRDIKPSNILVTLHDGVPVPKVIDFGIAKATEQRLTDKTLFTEFQSFIGTPAYTSPEQAEMSGLDIDTRSDIYSLGVLLYELLIGETPFDAGHLLRSGLDEMRRIIREDEPVRPSTRLGTFGMAEATTLTRTHQTKMPALVEAVRGDLDWIVMRCLEKDRTRRYATANDLAADIQRYLDDEPVLARPPSNLYRLQKLFRRHQGAFAAAAAIAVTLLAGSTISTWLAVRATRAEKTALASQKQESFLRLQAEREKASARLNEYIADINLAQQSLAAGNYGRAVQLLNKHRREPGEPDLRGFEWRYLWQVSRGDNHTPLSAQDGPVQSLAISPVDNLVAIGQRDKSSISVWNLSTRSLVANLPKGGLSLAFSPDGKKLFSAGPGVRVWNTANWAEEKTLSENSGLIALSGDGTRLAALGREGVRFWDTSNWNQLRLFEGATGPMAFSPDGKSLATDSRAGITIWPLDETGIRVVLQNSTNLFSRPGPWFRGDHPMAFSPDGRFVVAPRNTLSERGVFVLGIWDAQTGQEDGVMPADVEHIEHAGTITSLAFSPDGKTLATASMDHSIRLWDFEKRQPITALQGHLSEVWTLAFSPDGRTLISGSRDGDVKLWPTQAQRTEDVITGVRHPLAFSTDGRTLAGVTRDRSAVVFLDLVTSETPQQFPLENRRGRFGPFLPAVAVSDDLRTLAHAQDDGTVKLWNTSTHDATTLKVSDGPAELLALSPDGRVLITRGRDWALRKWDLRGGTNTAWPADAFRVLFSRDGRLLATVGRGDDVQLWDAATLAPQVKLKSDEPPAMVPEFIAAFSADGRVLAVACQDDAIRLWDTATGQLLGACTGHKQGVRSVAFAPDGKTLATTSDDSTLKLWNTATQQELLTIRQLGATLTGLTFSPDGRFLVGGSGAFSKTGGLRFFRAPPLNEIDAGHAEPVRRVELP